MSNHRVIPALTQNEFRGRIGVARSPINPPEGMFVRTWGSATHDIADGVHKPLYATCLAVADDTGRRRVLFVALDLMVWMSKLDEEDIRLPLHDEFDLAPGALVVHLSHSHGAPFTDTARSSYPGGELIATYRTQIKNACRRVIDEASRNMQPSVLSWGHGTCRLAHNRDLVDPATGEIMCGLNPDGPTDDTLLVGRVTGESGQVTATLINYACHPTSVGGGNRLISPDYIGAMREIVERDTDGAICVFLHGADGELTPRRSFEDSVEAADQNGRELGYAAMATLSSLFPPGRRLAISAREESGATLARWELAPCEVDTALIVRQETVRLKLRQLPSIKDIEQVLATATGFQRERAQRQLALREKLGDGDHFDLPIIVWRLGESVMVGAPVEFYNAFQVRLRERFPSLSVAVLNICNGYLSYLPASADYDKDVYTVRVAVFEKGGMELALEKATDMIRAVTDYEERS